MFKYHTYKRKIGGGLIVVALVDQAEPLVWSPTVCLLLYVCLFVCLLLYVCLFVCLFVTIMGKRLFC